MKIKQCIALMCVALTGCGGGGDEPPIVVDNTYSVTVIDGYLSGAKVWLDKNGNDKLDVGEPQAITNERGVAKIPVSGTPNYADYPLVAVATAGVTKDADLGTDGAVVNKGYLLKSPKGISVITPLTTLASLMQEEDESVDSAVAKVAGALSLEADVITSDFIENENDTAMRLAKSFVASEIMPEMEGFIDGDSTLIKADEINALLQDPDAPSDSFVIVDSNNELKLITVDASSDSDGDGFIDGLDDFPEDPTEWKDTDKDSIGDNSDTDDDDDGVLDTADAFPLDNTESADTDGDKIGDNSDTDDDNDGVLDTADAFPLDNTESVDTDGDSIGDNSDTDDDNDGVLDAADAFPLDNTESVDTDGDSIGDNRDTDDDNDGVLDTADAFPLDNTESVDTDGDGIGDNSDTDDDNDGVLDMADAFPLDNTESVDTDGDRIGDNRDTDDDNDDVLDSADAFPLDNTESVDTDGDGIGDNQDTDDDNDGVLDADDAYPLDSDKTNPNQTPTAGSKSIAIEENTNISITLSGVDADGDSLAFTFTAPGNGKLSGTAPTLTYTPTVNFHGVDSFDFTVDDGYGGTATGTISITVEPVTSRPDITVMSYNIMMLPPIVGDWDQNSRADHLPSALRTLDSLPDVIGYSEVLDDYSYRTISEIEEYPYSTAVGGLSCSGGGWDSITGPCSATATRGGTMLSSRYPIEEKHALIFSAYTAGSPDAMANKGAVYVKLNISGYYYHVVSTHFQATHDSGDDDEHLVRTDQMAEIRDWIDSMDIPATEPVIITGDFNVPFSHSLQMDELKIAGNVDLNYSGSDVSKGKYGSYTTVNNLMSKAFVDYFDDDLCYDDTLDYVLNRYDYLQPVEVPEMEVIALKSPEAFYWSYLDATRPDCGGEVKRDGMTNDISDHYPVVATYVYPEGPDTAPVVEDRDPVALKKSDSRTTASLLPPDLHYSYFQNADDFPFEPEATELSWINGSWLADAAFLAYADEEFAKSQTAAAGLDQFAYFDAIETQCFLANNDEFAILSCRGTEPTNFSDWATDTDFTKTDAMNGGLVHKGFKDALDTVWGDIYPELQRLKSEGKTIWFTGHSLGAALAQVAADRFCISKEDCDLSGVYSFAGPGVGDQEYADNFYAPHYKFIYYHDPVPRLPGYVMGYANTPGEVVYFDYYGNYTGLQDYPVTVAPGPNFHAPFYYAVYTWNAYVNSLHPVVGSDTAETIVNRSAEGVIIDNTSSDYAEVGTWETATANRGEYEGQDYRLSIDPSATASWSFKVAEAGHYNISFKAPGAFGMLDTYYGSNATSFKLYQGEDILAGTHADLYSHAYDFTMLGKVYLEPNTVYSVVETGAYLGQYEYAISADAIKVVYAGEEIVTPGCGIGSDSLCVDPTQADVILDNDNSVADHYSESGGDWKAKSGSGSENGNYRYSADESANAQWAFSVAQTGTYKILFKSPGGFSYSHGYGSDRTVYKVSSPDEELSRTRSGDVNTYNNSYDFGDVEIATVTLEEGIRYNVNVSGAYTGWSGYYGIAADAIKLVYIAEGG